MFISNKFPGDSNVSGDFIFKSRELHWLRKKKRKKIRIANKRNKKGNIITINPRNIKRIIRDNNNMNNFMPEIWQFRKHCYIILWIENSNKSSRKLLAK